MLVKIGALSVKLSACVWEEKPHKTTV